MHASPASTAIAASQSPRDDFDAFYRRHAEALLAYFVRRTFEPQIALELTSETFAKALRHRSRFRGTSPEEAAAWLYGIAKNELRHYHRSGKVRAKAMARLRMQMPRFAEEDVGRLHELAGTQELRAEVARRFDELPSTLREAVMLRVLEELPYGEVARRLGVSEDAARVRVSRGLRAMRGAVEPLYREAAR